MTLTALGSMVVSIEALGDPVVAVYTGAGALLWSADGSGLVTPDTVSGSGRSNAAITVGTALATAQGGTSYLWTQTSGDADWSIYAPTEAQTYFVHANTAPNMVYTATFQVAISYPGGGTANGTVTARARNYSNL